MSERETVDRPATGTPITGAPPSPGRADESASEHVDREFTVKARSQTSLILRRFRQHKLALASLVMFVLIVLWAFVVPVFWKYGYRQETLDISQAPSAAHPFGTDSNGTDMFAEVMRGTQRSLEIALFVAFVATVWGSLWGAIAGYSRGKVDTVMMRIVDLFLTFPIIAIAALLGYQVGSKANGWFYVAVVIAALTWPYISRVIRGVVLSLREKEFIEAARALGASYPRVILRHLIPNAMGTIIVTVTVQVALAILVETALSFLGFGVQFPDVSLGLLVNQNQTAVLDRPWLFYFPGLFIILICLTVNFVGDGLRDAFDPTQTRVRA